MAHSDEPVQREQFYEKFNKVLCEKLAKNCFYISKERYTELIAEVRSAKVKQTNKSAVDYRRLKRFDVLKVNDTNRLIVPLKSSTDNIIYYVDNDEVFDILQEVHIRTGHGGRNKMVKELQLNYKNITTEVVMIYLNLCSRCQMKSSVVKRATTKPITCADINSRCQVDIIDMEVFDNEYKFVLVYQDCATKFVQLKPLKSNTAAEVAGHILDIFLLCGAPCILQADNGTEFAQDIITRLHSLWSDLKIVRGTHKKDTTGPDKDIKSILKVALKYWMKINNNNWSEGLKFVQFERNTTFNEEIQQTPYEATFGKKAQRGIATLPVPKQQIINITTEDELHGAIQSESLLTEQPSTREFSIFLEEDCDDRNQEKSSGYDNDCEESQKCIKCNMPGHHECCMTKEDNEMTGNLNIKSESNVEEHCLPERSNKRLKLSDEDSSTVLELQRKWRSLRDAYRREIRIRERGSNPNRRPYIYYKQLQRIFHQDPNEQPGDDDDDDDVYNQEDSDWNHSPEPQADADANADVDPDADLDPDAPYDEPPEIAIKQEIDVELDPLVTTSGAGSRKRRARTADEQRPRRHRAEHATSPAIQTSSQPIDEDMDSERLFLLSFASEMRQLSPSVRMWARAEIAAVMQEAVARDCGQTTSGNSFRSSHKSTRTENCKN